MKKILIPTDFSQNAGDALSYCLDLVGNQQAKIHIIHVIDPVLIPTGESFAANAYIGSLMDEANENMEALEAMSNQFFSDHEMDHLKVSTEVLMGSVPQSIHDEAERVKADMIIMGTQGKNHTKTDKFMGTVSTEVVNQAPCPILLIPLGYKYRHIDHVMFSTDLNHSDPYELWRVIEILGSKVSTIRCLHVVKKERDFRENEYNTFTHYMQHHSPAKRTICDVVAADNIEDAIMEYAVSNDIELIIMHKIKQGFWGRLFNTSHTRNMVSMTELPLCIISQ